MVSTPLVAAASGLLLLAVGCALLLARPNRRGGVFFAVFAALWGAEIALLNASRVVTSPATALLLVRVALAVKIPQALLLLHFAASIAPESRLARTARPLAAALACVTAVYFVVAPDAFVSGVIRAPSGFWGAQFGVANVLLQGFPSFFAFYLTADVVLRHYLATSDDLARREAGIIAAALFVYLGFVSAYYSLYYTAGWSAVASGVGSASAALFAVLFVSGSAFLIVTATRLLQRLRKGNAPAQRITDRALLACIALPAAVGVAGVAPLVLGGSPFDAAGLFRVASAALIAYGILKHQLFGLDLGLKRLVRGGTPVAAFAVAALFGGAVTRAASSDVTVALIGGGILGLVGAAAVFPLRHRAADIVFPFVQDDADYRRARAVEVYRAALAQAAARGRLTVDDPFLRELRGDLGISARDHELLALVVQAETAAAPAAPPPAPVAGRYERGRLLGEGGFARVWLAKDTRIGRDVVLKEMFRPGDAAALAEARAAGAMAHPNLVTVFDVVYASGASVDGGRAAGTASMTEHDRPCIVMEYVEGGSLQDVLDRDGTLPRERALAVAADVLRGLDALHRRGLVHRDVKPANVLLTSDGRAKVSDLGVAAEAESGGRNTVGVAAAPGTLHYMSPEAVDGLRLDARADLYGVAALLYQCLAGRFYLDFADQGDYRVRRLIKEGAPRLPLKGESEALNAILARALAKRPEDRFASAAEMLAAVTAAQNLKAAQPMT